jgi:hypothetical protein
MHNHRSGSADQEHDADLVLERLPSGEMAWLRPDTSATLMPVDCQAPPDDDERRPGRWNGEWHTYVCRVVTTYSLIAPSREMALEWFTDAADVELVDCDAMTFGKPRLVAVLTDDAQQAAQPVSRLRRFARRFASFTRPLAFPAGSWAAARGGGQS